MKTRRTIIVEPTDYTSTVEWLNSKGYKFNVEWIRLQEHFVFEYESEENYYIACMNDLSDMAKNSLLSYEEKDALNTGISAIKQLMDMGVLK